MGAADGFTPCEPSRIGAYLSQFGTRLVVPRPRKRLSDADPTAPALPVVHGCWPMDTDERVPLSGLGVTHILNMVDHASGVKVGAFLLPAQRQAGGCRLAWPQYQHALRVAFTRWGLPDRLRTDRDTALVASGESPFPMRATLWLVGLGIEHELIRRVTQNGAVERSHRPWEGRLLGYGPLTEHDDWQMVVNYERWRMNAILPSRGRRCQRQPPFVVYPQVHTPRRYYRLADEPYLFDSARVQRYLAQGTWLRRTSSQGQFSLNDQVFNLGRADRQRWVQITYLPDVGFRATCPPDETVRLTFHLSGLTAAEIMALPEGVSLCEGAGGV